MYIGVEYYVFNFWVRLPLFLCHMKVERFFVCVFNHRSNCWLVFPQVELDTSYCHSQEEPQPSETHNSLFMSQLCNREILE